MTAPCPALGFIVVIEPVAGLGEAERDALRDAWNRVLQARGLHAHARIGTGRSAIVVTSEASQATENDREAMREWLASRAELRHSTVGDIVDLAAHSES